MSRCCIVVLYAVGLLLVANAVGGNSIHQWSGDPNDVIIFQPDTVVILAPGTFGFEALDPNGPDGLGYFQEISIDPNCSAGTVNVYILHDPNDANNPGGPGAVNVYYLHLVDPNVPNVIGNITELNITGDLGEYGATKASNAGPLTVDGVLRSDLVIDDDITGDMTFAGLAGNISCDLMQNLTVGQSVELFTPDITIRHGYSAVMEVDRGLRQLSIGGLMSGTIETGWPVWYIDVGAVGVGGIITTGTAGFNTQELNVAGPVSGTITIGGTVEDLEVGDGISGTVSIGGKVWGGLIDGDVTGTLAIGTDLGDTVAPSPLEIDGAVNGTEESVAVIDIGQDLVTKLQIDGEIGPYGRVTVARDLKDHGSGYGLHMGELRGTVHIGNELQGWFTLGGAADTGLIEVLGCLSGEISSVYTFGGRASVGGDLTGTFAAYNFTEFTPDLTGAIVVDGNVSGTITIEGHLDDRGDPAEPNNPYGPLSGGHIIIDGGLQAGAWIEIGLRMAGQTEFVTVNYDAYGLEAWGPEATIVLGDGEFDHYYHENTPAQRLWAVTPCRGDLNNSGAVGFGDINPYIVAKNYPDTYALTYPGLGAFQTSNMAGSRIWHGDANCDEVFNSSDDNPFVARVIAQCCDSDCPGCQGGRNEGGEGAEGPPDLPAEDLAAELAANVWPELYEDLLGMVLETIDGAPNEEVQAYWQTVYATLTQ
jgi:hypothetical protein